MAAADQHRRQRGVRVSPSLIRARPPPTTAPGRHRHRHHAPGGQRAGGRADDADDGAGRRPRRRHRAGRRASRATAWPARPAPPSGSAPKCKCYDGTFTVSFAGFAPADDPEFTVYVVVQNPRNGGGGGSVAGPAFSKIMSFVLRRYAGAPDRHQAVLPARRMVTHGPAVTSRRGERRGDPTGASGGHPAHRPRVAWLAENDPGSSTRGDLGRGRRHRGVAELAADPARRRVRRPAGRRAHGIDFADAALAAGAVAVLTDPAGAGSGARTSRCWSSTSRARARAASRPACTASRRTALRLIGVTGTQGKTTTTRLARERAPAAGVTAAVIGTVGTRDRRRRRQDRADDARGAGPARRCSR